MINCNGNCNQGRSCNCGIGQPDEDKMDKIAKYVLIFTALYFFFHMAVVFANPQYPAPIIRCIPGGGGTVTCFPI